MPKNSLIDYLKDSARWKHDVAVVWKHGYRTERWTYGRLIAAANGMAAELEARGVARGDRVLLWGANSGEWIAAFWAVLLRGAVAVPMDFATAPDFVHRVIRQVNPRLLLLDAVFQQEFAATEFAPRIVHLAQLAPQANGLVGAPATPPLSRSDIAEILFTSGSTAEPKGVVLTHGNLLANIEPLEREIAKYRKYERWVHPLRFLEMLPLSHVFGQFMGLLVPQLLGATVVFTDTLNPSEMIRTARRERVSVLVAVPRVLESLRTRLEQQEHGAGRSAWFDRNYQSAANEPFWKRWWRFRRIHGQLGWRFWAVISGGAALGWATEEFWRRLGLVVIQGYGLTETASLVTLRHPFRKGAGTIGQALPDRDVKLDEHGEILVRGENIAAGYWGPRNLTPIADEAGWFRTGDLGEMDSDGNIRFKGRKKNVLVTAAGMNVYPEDIEGALRAQPEVRDCAVVAIQFGGREEACAGLVLQAANASPEEVVARANQSLAEYQRLRYWLVWPHEDLPRTSTGKPRLNLIRDALQSHFAAGSSETGPYVAGVTTALNPLQAILQRMGRPADVTSSSTLEGDLKLSSIDRVELLSEIEDRFQMDVNEAEFAKATTVGELEKLLKIPAASGSPYPYVRWPRHWAVAALREIAWWALVQPAMLILGFPSARGRENTRGLKNPFLLVANHQTEIDAAFILAALPGRLRRRMAIAMVGERLRDMRHPLAGTCWPKRLYDPIGYILLTAFFHVFPLPKQSGVRGSFEYIGELVDQGWSVMIFPEGQLTRDGTVGTFRSGIGVLARSLGIAVLPVRISGLYELRKSGRKHADRGEILVKFGHQVQIDPALEPEEIAARLREEIAVIE